MATEDGKPADGDASKDSKGDAQGGDAAKSFDDWVKDQPEETKKLIDGHIAGLKSTLSTLKDERKTLKDQIKEIQSSKELDAEQRTKAIEDKLEQSEKRIAFLENLPAEIKNAKAAWTLATTHSCLKRDGSLDVDKFKEQFPELFTGRKASANAGDGAGNPPTGTNSPMNQALRRAAGYGG